MTQCSALQFWVASEFCVLVLAAGVTFLVAWAETRPSWTVSRTLDEVWRAWGAGPGVHAAVAILTGVTVGVNAAALLAAWFFAPQIHRTARLGTAFLLSHRVVGGGAGLLAVFVLVVGAGLGWMNTDPGLQGMDDHLGPLLMLCAVSALCTLVMWLDAGIRHIGEQQSAPVRTPCCEGCGYDLTHVPQSGVCTECGLDVDMSLVPGRRRRASAWEERRGAAGWMETTVEVLRRPSAFYSSLRMDGGNDDAYRFSAWHHALMGMGAALWIGTLMLIHFPFRFEGIVVPPIIGVLTVLVGWTARRAVGAIAATWWAIQRYLPDGRRAARVNAYETAFLWVFCALDGSLITFMIEMPSWMRSAIPRMIDLQVVRVPTDLAALLLGNGALIAVYLWRHVVAGRGVRWGNC